MPSRYEPCGLGQMIAMRYGTPVVARKTGGIADTVGDYMPLEGKGTGFLFEDASADGLKLAIKNALCAYRSGGWMDMVKSAMRMDFSWKRSVSRYIEIYKNLAGGSG